MGTPSPTEILIILLILLLLFGAKKLPELARGTGRALRIFKAETKGLVTDDDDETPTDTNTRPQLSESQPSAGPVVPPPPVTHEQTPRTDTDR